MKKYIVICFFLFAFLLLAGCGKVAEAEQAIDAIGKVSIESQDDIENAEDLVESLSERRQEKVYNLRKLSKARDEYDRLATAVDKAKDAIKDIGTVTLSSGDIIQKARDAYTALEVDDLTKYVSDSYPVLLAAENQFAYLCAEEIYETAHNYYDQKKYAEAMTQLQELEQKYPNSSFANAAVELNVKCIVSTANALYDQGRYEEAIDVLDVVIAEHSEEIKNTSAVNLRSQCHMAIATDLYSQGQFEDAVKALDAFMKKHPEEAKEASAAKLSAQCYVTMATNLYDQSHYEEALDVLDAFIKKHPVEAKETTAAKLGAQCYVAIATNLYNQADPESALLRLTEAERCYPDELSWAGGNALRDQINGELDKIRPKNGKVLTNQGVTGGYSEFTVEASTNYDALVKLEMVDNPDNYVLFYVRAGEKATVSVKQGVYCAKYTTGARWYGEDLKFGRTASYSQADQLMEFSISYEGNYVYYSAITITLYTTFGGNLSTSDISADEF